MALADLQAKAGAMPAPSFQSSSSAASGPATATGSSTGSINFGGSGMGGTSVGGGGFNVGALVAQYWPLLLAVGVVWYIRRRKSR